MRIFLTNDDGYTGEGLHHLANFLRQEHDVFVCVPDKERSGCSHSLTFKKPLSLSYDTTRDIYYTDGTPVDCVYLAFGGAFCDAPDIVVSGINHSQNMGDDIFYSGTVAAAREGLFRGVHSLALSLAGYSSKYYEPISLAASDIIHRLGQKMLDHRPVLFNINAPDVACGDIMGHMITQLGPSYQRKSPMRKIQSPDHRDLYWVNTMPVLGECDRETDFFCVAHSMISLTPLSGRGGMDTIMNENFFHWLRSTSGQIVWQRADAA